MNTSLTDINGGVRRFALLLTLQLSLSCGTAFAQNAGDVISGTVSDAIGPIMMANVDRKSVV